MGKQSKEKASPASTTQADRQKKAMVRGTISYLESQGLPVNKSAIFRHFELSRSQGYSAMTVPPSLRNDPHWEEKRGRNRKISDEDQAKMESILWDEQYDNTDLTWAALAKEAGVDASCSKRTLHRTMGTLGYRRCLRCGRAWVHKKNRERRMEYSKRMAELFPQPQSWRRVRFSGELTFGFDPDGRVRLVPREGEKHCVNCAEDGKWTKDVKTVSAWVAIGYGFKSELVFYDGTMEMADYRDKILDGVVKGWVERGDDFVLEEDFDVFAHGGLSKVNLVQTWREKHALESRFGCSESPDLSPLDSLWPVGKTWERQEGAGWEEEELREAARKAWEGIDQDRINLWVEFMPSRLRQVVEIGGRMVPW